MKLIKETLYYKVLRQQTRYEIFSTVNPIPNVDHTPQLG